MARRNRDQHSMDVWPGFVDAISTLLLLFVFMMALFSVISFSLGQSLSGKKAEISDLETQVTGFEGEISGLSSALQKAKREQTDLLNQLRDLVDLKQTQENQQKKEISNLDNQVIFLTSARDRLSKKLALLETQQKNSQNQKELLNNAQGQIGVLNQTLEQQQQELQQKSQAQINAEAELLALKEQFSLLTLALQNVESALSLRDETIQNQKVQISDLGNRINEALASEVNQLQKYRSDFFGKLRQALGDNNDVQIQGDRFVISSGILFSSASAVLEQTGSESVNRIAAIIQEIAKEIPSDIDWVIRVDGHTDNKPYTGTQYLDNWDLSNARALSVVRQLIKQGISPKRLIAAGFGEFHPINTGTNNQDLAQNRRIEIKLTQK